MPKEDALAQADSLCSDLGGGGLSENTHPMLFRSSFNIPCSIFCGSVLAEPVDCGFFSSRHIAALQIVFTPGGGP